jgi:hypothetical protein
MILLAGGNGALLEGLAQALASTGHKVVVAHSADEAEQLARQAPILTVSAREMVSDPDPEHNILRGVVAGGGALITYREAGDTSRALSAPVARHVLADLVLPLERNRLVALAERVASRAKAVGRNPDVTAPDSHAS